MNNVYFSGKVARSMGRQYAKQNGVEPLDHIVAHEGNRTHVLAVKSSEEDKVMSNEISVATIEAKLRAMITTTATDGELIVVSDESLRQMQLISDTMVTATAFDIEALTPEQLAAADIFADRFSNNTFTGQIRDGQLQPMNAVTFEMAIDGITRTAKQRFTPQAVLPAFLVNKIIQEVKQFSR